MGKTFGSCGTPTPFEAILIDLAGPVADYWGESNPCLLRGEKDDVDHALASIAGCECLNQDDGDWDSCLRRMAEYGIDVLDKKKLSDMLPIFLDAVRSTLNLCETEWQEVTEYLAVHGKIGWDGEHWDAGEAAESFYFKWGGDLGESQEAVTSCVEKFRVTALSLIRSTAS